MPTTSRAARPSAAAVRADDRDMVAPPGTAASRARRAIGRRAMGALVVSVVLLLAIAMSSGSTSGPANVDTASGEPAARAQPTTLPPWVSSVPPAEPTPPSSTSATSRQPCLAPSGQPLPPDCIPPPVTSTPTPGETSPDGGGEDGGCDFWDPSTWLDCLLRDTVTAALDPLLELMGKTLLTTPHPSSLPAIGVVWTNSFHLLLASYALLVLIAGGLVMAHESIQSRHSIKEIAPRLVVGFLTGVLSQLLAGHAISIANALAAGVMGDGLGTDDAASTLQHLIMSALTGGVWILLIGIILAAALVALLISYVIRVALTVILIGAAPLALMFHALPHTEGIAYWWWKAFGACLAIQIAQSLVLVTALRVFLAPGGFTFFGAVGNGLVNMLVALALTYILWRIPFWILSSVRVSNSRSMLVGLAKTYVAGRALGAFGRRHDRGTSSSNRSDTAAPAIGTTTSTRIRRPQPAPATREAPDSSTATALRHDVHRQRLRRLATPRRPRANPPRWQSPGGPATGAAPRRPAMPLYQSPETTPTDPAPTPPPTPRTAPSRPRFHEPGIHAPDPGSSRPIRTATAPAELVFRPASPDKPLPPVRASMAPAAPRFRAAKPIRPPADDR